MVTSSGRTAGMAANSASSISRRGWARVMSHTEMATRWPARTSVAERRPSDRRGQRRGERRAGVGQRGS